MKKIPLKRIFAAAALVCCLTVTTAYADVTQEDIDNAKNQINNLKNQQKDAQDAVDDINGKKGQLESDLNNLNGQMTNIVSSMNALESQINDKKKELSDLEDEIDQTQDNLEAAKQQSASQYEDMKIRIRYMYENGNQEYLDIIFGAKSISDLLNRSEYVEKISEYDNKVFAHFKKAALTVQQKEKQREQQTNELKELETKTREEKQAVSELKADKKTELDKIDKAMEKSQDQVSEYTKKALEAENQVEALLQKKQDEIDREMAAGGGNSGGSTTGFGWPLKGGAGRISSGFGGRKSPTAGASTYHKGVDLAAPSGTPILAVGSGKVVTATYSSSAGNYIMISHGNRLYTVYMHCSRLAVSAGKQVTKGQVIGYVGSTGISTGAHLHFGVTKNGSYVNPLNYISR